MNIAKAVILKIISTLLMAGMAALIRYIGSRMPVGQVVFFRSLFGLIPVIVVLTWRRQLGSAFHTGRLSGHLFRGVIAVSGMFLAFAAIARLPLADSTAISFTTPLITVVLCAIFLKETVRIYRWSAVVVGFVGVVIMLWPYLSTTEHFSSASSTMAVGAMLALVGAFFSGAAVVQTRRLTESETTGSIVLYLTLFPVVMSALLLPFIWQPILFNDLLLLIAIGMLGGSSHLLLTESYRYSPASVVAPLDYISMIWAFLIGYFLFDELPTVYIYIGSVIVIASGLFVLWRERQLGLRRPPAEGSPLISSQPAE